MIVSPTFLVCILIPAQHKQRDVGGFCYRHCFRDQFLIVCRIAETSAVGKPVAAFFRYLATFGIDDFNFVADLVLDSLKHADGTPGLVAVTTKMDLGCIWTN